MSEILRRISEFHKKVWENEHVLCTVFFPLSIDLICSDVIIWAMAGLIRPLTHYYARAHAAVVFCGIVN